MTKIKVLLLMCAFLCFASCGSSETELTGNIFIVTKDAENIKLGAVEVHAIPESLIKEHVESRKQQSTDAFNKYAEIKNKCDGLTGYVSLRLCLNEVSETQDEISSVYFAGLPAYSATAKTDADGKFTLKIPKTGKYALIAQASRFVGDSAEYYYWMIWVNADGKPKQVILSNNNLIFKNSPDQVVTGRY